MKNNLALIYNYAQHYRKGIFALLDKNLNIDFFFGDKISDIKQFDYKLLQGFRKECKSIVIYKNIYFQTGVIKLLGKYDKYIFLGEYYCLSTWLFLLFSKCFKSKVYLWTHGWYGNESFIKRIVKKIFFNLSDGLLLYGNYAKQLMIKEGFKESKLHVIYNSLDYNKQITFRKKLKQSNIYQDYFKNNDPVLIFIGRLTRVKKLDQLIEAQKLSTENNVKFNVVFIGDGAEKNILKNLVSKNKFENRYWFYGACYDESEIANLLFNADLCVSPGNVGLTAMHSMMYGTPVITHNNFKNQMPEFEAIKSNETGLFFEENDVLSLAKSISEWLAKSKNRDSIRQKCFYQIDNFYNINYQYKIINKIINETNS